MSTQSQSISNPEPHALTVFYDGSCPLCAREIGFYRKRKGSGAIDWVDASNVSAPEVVSGLTKADALARFHARTPEGEILSGADAFVQIWLTLPGFRWIGAMCRLRPIAWGLEKAYTGFLRVRPIVQKFVRRAAAQ